MTRPETIRGALCIVAGLGVGLWLVYDWLASEAPRDEGPPLISLADYRRDAAPVMPIRDSEVRLAAWHPDTAAPVMPIIPLEPATAPQPPAAALLAHQPPAPPPAPPALPPDAAVDPPEPVVPGEEGAVEPGGAISPAPPVGGIVLPTGAEEPYTLTVPPQIGALKSSFAAHRWLKITELLQGKVLVLTATRVGRTELTLIGEMGTVTIPVEAVPSISDIDAVLTRQFPNSSLRITQVAANILMVEGAVDSAAEIQPVMELLKSLVPSGNVINAMHVAGPMQVQLEVIICRVDRTRLRQLGFNFLGGGNPWFAGSTVGDLITPVPVTGGTPIPQLGGPVSGTPFDGGQTSIFLGLTQNNKQIGAYIQALERQSAAKVLARPVLVTLSGRPAEFLNGGKQPYPVVSGLGQNPSVQFEKFGTRLVFLPVVMGQGRLRLEIAPSVSAIDEQFATAIGNQINLPRILEQSVHSTVEMESGQTLVIGGMFQNEMVSIVEKVPVLGDLPLAGMLFRNTQNVLREQELMVLVTPKLVHPLEPYQAPCRLPGDETRPPDDCELYVHGLPEVEAALEGEMASQIHPGNPAPAMEQYPRWEPRVAPQPIFAPPADELPAGPDARRPAAPTLRGASRSGVFRPAPAAAPPNAGLPPVYGPASYPPPVNTSQR